MKITDEQIDALNAIADTVYENATNKGFHEDDGDEDPNYPVAFAMCGSHAFLSKIWEKHRKGEDYNYEGHNLPLMKPEVDSGPGFLRYLVNLHGEVTELFDAWISDEIFSPCEKAVKMEEMGLFPLTCAEEELADIIIRVLDTAKSLKINIGEAVRTKAAYNESRPYRHGNKSA